MTLRDVVLCEHHAKLETAQRTQPEFERQREE
jgi:hypothetical protein